VGAENDRCGIGDFIEFFNKNRAALFEVFDHKAVVDDFMADVDRCAEEFNCALDDFNRAVNTGAKTAGIGKENVHNGRILRALRTGTVARKYDDPDGSGDDGGIGEIERGPVPLTPVPLDKVDHMAVKLAVDEITERAADHQ